MRQTPLILSLLSLAGCGANQHAQFERAIECEMATGIVGAHHPNLRRTQIASLQQANRRYHERSEELGASLAKSGEEVDGARRTYLEGVQRRMSGPDRNRVTEEFVQNAETCKEEIA